jgi:hypothetical protein
MRPYKRPVTKPCTNHGAFQGTYHWDLYEPWGTARYLSLRLVQTMGPCKVPVTETCMNHWVLQNRYTRTGSTFLIMQMDHDGSSLSLCLFALFCCWVWQWTGFHSQTNFFHHCHDQTIQPTKLTNQPTNQTHFLHYFNIQYIHKADSCWVVKTLICIYKTWQFISTLTKSYTLSTYRARWIQSTAWNLFL